MPDVDLSVVNQLRAIRRRIDHFAKGDDIIIVQDRYQNLQESLSKHHQEELEKLNAHGNVSEASQDDIAVKIPQKSCTISRGLSSDVGTAIFRRHWQQHLAARRIQSHFRRFVARVGCLGERHRKILAARLIQLWWRRTLVAFRNFRHCRIEGPSDMSSPPRIEFASSDVACNALTCTTKQLSLSVDSTKRSVGISSMQESQPVGFTVVPRNSLVNYDVVRGGKISAHANHEMMSEYEAMSSREAIAKLGNREKKRAQRRQNSSTFVAPGYMQPTQVGVQKRRGGVKIPAGKSDFMTTKERSGKSINDFMTCVKQRVIPGKTDLVRQESDSPSYKSTKVVPKGRVAKLMHRSQNSEQPGDRIKDGDSDECIFDLSLGDTQVKRGEQNEAHSSRSNAGSMLCTGRHRGDRIQDPDHYVADWSHQSAIDRSVRAHGPHKSIKQLCTTRRIKSPRRGRSSNEGRMLHRSSRRGGLNYDLGQGVGNFSGELSSGKRNVKRGGWNGESMPVSKEIGDMVAPRKVNITNASDIYHLGVWREPGGKSVSRVRGTRAQI